MLPLADRVRAKAGPTRWDVRTNTLTIRRRTWSGLPGAVDSVPTDVDLTLSPRPKIRELSLREVSSSGGRFEAGDIRVGPITPAYTVPAAGGYTPEQLKPTTTLASIEALYIVTGPNAGTYSLVDLDTSRATQYMMTVRRKRP